MGQLGRHNLMLGKDQELWSPLYLQHQPLVWLLSAKTITQSFVLDLRISGWADQQPRPAVRSLIE